MEGAESMAIEVPLPRLVRMLNMIARAHYVGKIEGAYQLMLDCGYDGATSFKIDAEHAVGQ